MSARLPTAAMDAAILAGGQGRRMGTGVVKARLELGGQALIERSLAVLQPMFARVFVVVRDPAGWEWLGDALLTDDRREGGPLVGLARARAASQAEWCFVVGCDMPFLSPGVIGHMACYAFGVDAVAVRTGRFYQPLHAFYRRSCLPVIEESLRQGMMSVQDLFRNVRVRAMDVEDFRLQDPEMLSFQDIDTPEDYARAQQTLLRCKVQGRTGICVFPQWQS